VIKSNKDYVALGTAKHNTDYGLDQLKASLKRKPESNVKRGKFDGLSRKQKRTKMSREDDAQALVQQKASARSAKQNLKPQKMTQMSDGQSARPSAPPAKKKRATKGFDQELSIKKATPKAATGASSKKFKAKNNSKTRHKKRI
jgi:ATP-dependent RNA helicase DDX27